MKKGQVVCFVVAAAIAVAVFGQVQGCWWIKDKKPAAEKEIIVKTKISDETMLKVVDALERVADDQQVFLKRIVALEETNAEIMEILRGMQGKTLIIEGKKFEVQVVPCE